MDTQLSLFNIEKETTNTHKEYFFIISFNESIKQDIKLLKKNLFDIINNETTHNIYNRNSIAHISIQKIFIKEDSDDQIIEWADKSIGKFSCFRVKINGVDIFTHGKSSKTIYYKIEKHQPIIDINNLFPFQNKFTPHVTLARSITLDDFNKISGKLSLFDYRKEFLCNRITILVRTSGKYSVLHEVVLQPI
jgi:2'-5' RNA ligase